MSNEFTDSLVPMFRQRMAEIGAKLQKVQTFNLSINYVIVNGRSLDSSKFYSALFPYTESEILGVIKNSNARVGTFGGNPYFDIHNHVNIYDSQEEYVANRFSEKHVKAMERTLAQLTLNFSSRLVGKSSGNFRIESAISYIKPLRSVCIIYSKEGNIEGNLAFRISGTNVMTNGYWGQDKRDFEELIKLIGVEVKWI